MKLTYISCILSGLIASIIYADLYRSIKIRLTLLIPMWINKDLCRSMRIYVGSRQIDRNWSANVFIDLYFGSMSVIWFLLIRIDYRSWYSYYGKKIWPKLDHRVCISCQSCSLVAPMPEQIGTITMYFSKVYKLENGQLCPSLVL